MTLQTPTSYDTAARDFTEARKRAALRQIVNRITGESDELLSYNEVRRQLLAETDTLIEKGVYEVPLENIVGSVGRYQDFTRDFLPKRDSDKERWVRVRASVIDMKGWTPIDVYKVGEMYFVKDGNHRVSVARQLGVPTITATVTEIKTNVDLKPGENPSEVIAQANYELFLQRTGLKRLRPQANLTMTLAGGYRELLAEIEIHGQILERNLGMPLSADDKVSHWYDEVYSPVIHIIREQGVLHNFPRRTETDVYTILAEHQEELEDALGWTIDPRLAAGEWSEQQREQAQSPVIRLGRMLRHAVVPDDMEDGPEAGLWRRQRDETRRHTLFGTLLVALEGIPEDTETLDVALRVAQWEQAHVNGIYLATQKGVNDSPFTAVSSQFEERLAEFNLDGDLATVVVNKGIKPLVKRARWVDLAVVSLTDPPEPEIGARRHNRFVRLIRQSPRPILAVPGIGSPLSHALLAYDGSPKADEALFLACYVAQRWDTALTVLTVTTEYTSSAALDGARDYLESNLVSAEYVLQDRHIADAILDTSAEYGCDWLIMGGFGFRPLKHLVLGSTVDRILREFGQPMLICR